MNADQERLVSTHVYYLKNYCGISSRTSTIKNISASTLSSGLTHLPNSEYYFVTLSGKSVLLYCKASICRILALILKVNGKCSILKCLTPSYQNVLIPSEKNPVNLYMIE